MREASKTTVRLTLIALATAMPLSALCGGNASASTENVVARVLPSVVTVRSQSGLGSAFAFGGPGYFVTNLHVVSGSSNVRLVSSGGVEVEGRVAAIDGDHDLAIIRSGLRPNPLTPTSGKPKIGADVLAIGSPLGLDGSVSKGIISAIDRKGKDGASIQTNIALNPGNSGGPLIDERGQVIGVNTSVADSSEGIGFAVPIKFAQRLFTPAAAAKAPAADRGFASTRTIAIAAALGLLVLSLMLFRLIRKRRNRVRVKLKRNKTKSNSDANHAAGDEIEIDLHSKSAT